MRVRESYRDREHSICRDHYDHTPDVGLSLGPVLDARDLGGCEICDGRWERERADRDAQLAEYADE